MKANSASLVSVLRNLKPGNEVEISKCKGGYCSVFRTHDGLKLKYVRHTKNGFEVFASENYPWL